MFRNLRVRLSKTPLQRRDMVRIRVRLRDASLREPVLRTKLALHLCELLHLVGVLRFDTDPLLVLPNTISIRVRVSVKA